MLSNTEATKLGDRLRSPNITDEDLVMLDQFRQTFSTLDQQAYAIIQNALHTVDGSTITKRKRKTQQSIVDKLRRQPKLRLPQMQDIAGCRIVLHAGALQAHDINQILRKAFEQQQWQIDSKPREEGGYRAIHLITKRDKKFYEIQLRTYAQDIWANLVESLSDEKNTLKYGGSEQEQALMTKLKHLSEAFAGIDLQAHTGTVDHYQRQIEEAIRHVLSD